MFNKLKEKLKKAVQVFSKEAEEKKEIPKEKPKKEVKKKKEKKVETPVEAAEEEVVEEIVEEVIEEQEEVKEVPEAVIEEVAEEIVEEQKEPEEPVKEKKGFFSRIKEKVTTTQISEEKFEELFWELELDLLESDVAVEVIEKIKADLKELLTSNRISKGNEEEEIFKGLRKSIEELFVEPFDLNKKASEKKPFVIAMIGVNGCGKTTTMAKLTKYFQNNGKEVVLAAADTFRAAAIQQAEHHAKKLNVPIISQGYGADPAAVAFDAIKFAKAKNKDVVIIDTAGRLHSNTNLMNELEKLVRVNKPDMKIFVGEAITGNDAINQSREFNNLVGVDAIILTKADVDEKGGASISASYVTGKPILFLGTGQTYDDLIAFNKQNILNAIFE